MTTLDSTSAAGTMVMTGRAIAEPAGLIADAIIDRLVPDATL